MIDAEDRLVRDYCITNLPKFLANWLQLDDALETKRHELPEDLVGPLERAWRETMDRFYGKTVSPGNNLVLILRRNLETPDHRMLEAMRRFCAKDQPEFSVFKAAHREIEDRPPTTYPNTPLGRNLFDQFIMLLTDLKKTGDPDSRGRKVARGLFRGRDDLERPELRSQFDPVADWPKSRIACAIDSWAGWGKSGSPSQGHGKVWSPVRRRGRLLANVRLFAIKLSARVHSRFLADFADKRQIDIREAHWKYWRDGTRVISHMLGLVNRRVGKKNDGANFAGDSILGLAQPPWFRGEDQLYRALFGKLLGRYSLVLASMEKLGLLESEGGREIPRMTDLGARLANLENPVMDFDFLSFGTRGGFLETEEKDLFFEILKERTPDELAIGKTVLEAVRISDRQNLTGGQLSDLCLEKGLHRNTVYAAVARLTELGCFHRESEGLKQGRGMLVTLGEPKMMRRLLETQPEDRPF